MLAAALSGHQAHQPTALLPPLVLPGAAYVGNGYVLNLNKMGINDVIDLAFLHGYAEPVLLLLHEPEPAWVGK